MKTFAGCSITSKHIKEQLLSEDLWFWVTLSLISTVYGIILLVLRRDYIYLFCSTGRRPVYFEVLDYRPISTWKGFCVGLLW
jgi:hypothetical protein